MIATLSSLGCRAVLGKSSAAVVVDSDKPRILPSGEVSCPRKRFPTWIRVRDAQRDRPGSFVWVSMRRFSKPAET